MLDRNQKGLLGHVDAMIMEVVQSLQSNKEQERAFAGELARLRIARRALGQATASLERGV